jgi:AcrR family transcriptional regulator
LSEDKEVALVTDNSGDATRARRRHKTEWIDVGYRALVEGGVGRVKVEPLAALLGLTTGSFYHHFRKRQDLLDCILAKWETESTVPLHRAMRVAGPDPYNQFAAVMAAWGPHGDFDQAGDAAVRAWARASPLVRAVVQRVDDQRIELLTGIFLAFGYDAVRALVRARIVYFHQLGAFAASAVGDFAPHPYVGDVLIGTPPSSAT